MKMGTFEKRFVNATAHSQQVAERAVRQMRHVPVCAGWSYLDVGCGNGVATLHVADELGLRTIGVDLDPAQGFSRLAPFVFICLFASLNTLGLPAPVLGTVGGAAFGVYEGAAVTLAAMWVTACLQFLLARQLGGERLRTRLAMRLGQVSVLLARRGALAVAGGRLLPGPFSELNMAAGLTPLTFHDFAVGTLLGCAPKAAAWSAVGTALGSG